MSGWVVAYTSLSFVHKVHAYCEEKKKPFMVTDAIFAGGAAAFFMPLVCPVVVYMDVRAAEGWVRGRFGG